MAALTDLRRRASADRWIAIGVALAIVAVVGLRTVLFGWSPVAPDDARYLFVGLSVLSDDGPINPSGSVFLLRSPVYGVVLATGSTILGGDPIGGAEVVGLALAIACLLGAVRLGWLLAGPGGAVGATLALLATPIVWRLVGSLRIDLPQTAGVIAILLVVWRPSTRRWALGGVLFGLTILVKETVLPLALLPLAMLGFEPPRRVATWLAVYLAAALLIAGWWWALVWLQIGVVFPLNAIGVIEGRQVGLDLRIAGQALVLMALVVASWVMFVARARSDRGARLLVVAAACLAPAALYAASQGLNARNYAGLAVLSAVALGVAGAWSVAWVRLRLSGRLGGAPGEPAAASAGGRRRYATASLVAVLALAVGGGVVVGQRAAGRPATAGVSDELGAWLRANTAAGDRVAMTFRDRESMALRLFGSVEIANVTPVRIDPADDLSTYLWLGLRDRQAFGFTRAAWTNVLTRPGTRYLVLSGPHPFTPSDLAVSLTAGRVPGLTPTKAIEIGSDRAQVFSVDATSLAADLEAVPLHATAEAATAWLDLAAAVDGEDRAIERLLAVGPIVSGAGLDSLLARLGDAACTDPYDPGGGQDVSLARAVRLGLTGTC